MRDALFKPWSLICTHFWKVKIISKWYDFNTILKIIELSLQWVKYYPNPTCKEGVMIVFMGRRDALSKLQSIFYLNYDVLGPLLTSQRF